MCPANNEKDSMVFVYKYSPIDHWNKIKSLNIRLHIYDQLIF